MATNTMSIEQASTVLNSIVAQATGGALANVAGNNFATVAQTALLTGLDPIMNAISQVMSDTIFASRNYTAKFRNLRVDSQRYGNMVRKLNVADWDSQNNASYTLTDGESVDMYEVKVNKVVQTNFYGAITWERQITTFRDQLNVSLRSPDEFARFYSMLLTKNNNQIQQIHETLARALVVNLIAAIISENKPSRVIKLITEYNAETGLTLEKQDVYKPDNFPAFMAWTASRIARIKRMLTERSTIYHTNITGKEIARHTDYGDQVMYLYAPIQFDLNTRALAQLFHDDKVKLGYNELVSYWQSIDTPGSIHQTPVYMDNTGAVKTASAAVQNANVFGLITDRDAIGYTILNEHQNTTPMNARGEYWNTFFKWVHRYWMDNTENAVVLLLE